MPLPPDTRLGTYVIVAPIGAGGMGEVYRARDTRLNREVAIKVLPASVAGDEDRLARFEREAQAVAALSHPNILAVYEFGTHDGQPFVVMELLQGQTLRERLDQGPVPARRAIEVAIAIANGLTAAHGKHLVHRDLKPENVFLTHDGQIKILDFGLARSTATPAGSGATQTSAHTGAGTVMGTVGYMAPEQVRGLALDGRADLFSLGVLLYEMLTGTRAFHRETAAETMTAILREDPPDLATARTDLTPALGRIVHHALEKDPQERFQSARDVVFALTALSGSAPAVSGAQTAVAPGAGARRTPMLLVAVLALVAAGATAGWWVAGRDQSSLVVRLAVTPPDRDSRFGWSGFAADVEPHFAIAPDGRSMAFATIDGQGRRQLWVRGFDTFVARPLPGAEGGDRPFWSPDGQSIGFFADDKLKRVPLDGGPPRTICHASGWTRGAWGHGVMLFTSVGAGTVGAGLWQVPEGGGEPVRMDAGGRPDAPPAHWVSFMPDGRRFLYLEYAPTPADRRIMMGSLDGAERVQVVKSAFAARYVRSGHLLYVKDGVLVAQRFDADRNTLSGTAEVLVDDVALAEVPGQAAYDASPSGTIAYTSRSFFFESRLQWIARDGRALEEVGQPGGYITVSLAPNGRRLAFAEQDGTVENEEPPSQLSIVDLARRSRSRLTMPDVRSAENPVWSPDSARLAYAVHSRAGALSETRIQSVTGVGAGQVVATGPSNYHPIAWSPDGRHLLLHSIGGALGRVEMWMLDVDAGREPRPYVRNDGSVAQGQFSPDGGYVAYSSNVDGRKEVYVQRFPATDDRWQVSLEGGEQPRWRADGRELFYVAPGGSLVAAPMTLGATPVVGTPQTLFRSDLIESDFFFYGGAAMYDVADNGQRFLVNRLIRAPGADTIKVVLNAVGR